jgi:hypothetical protein
MMMAHNIPSYMSGRMSAKGGRGRDSSLDRGRGRFYGRTNKTRFKKTEAREQKFSPIEDQG